MKVDKRFMTEAGPEVFTGNDLLLKGALEAQGGVHYLGGYPGSPVAGFFEALAVMKDLLNEKGIRAVINNNEALAAAALNGTQFLPCRSLIVMKSVGVHVAADALALGNLAGANAAGGAIVVYGDDPWSDSTQVPSDSRYISKHLFMPTIEPSTPQEVKDFVDLSFKVSAASELYIGYVLTTNLADGGGTVMCRPNQYPTLTTHLKTMLETAAIDTDKRVLLPPKTWWQEATLRGRHERAARVARELGLNRIDFPAAARKPIGFVTGGLAHAYLLQALGELGLSGEFPILKLGLTYPVDREILRELAGQCDRLIVIEERRGFIEEQVGEIMLALRQEGVTGLATEVWGKRFPAGLKGIPEVRGLHPSILIERLAGLLGHLKSAGAAIPAGQDQWQRELTTIDASLSAEMGRLPPRLASFCPGCPHRDSANVCLEIKKRFMDEQYMQRAHKRGPMDLVFHGDTGCYTMLMYPPNTPLMHNYSGMGLGAGTGSGADPFITNKQVVFMGDSTFFHSGQIAISQAIKLCQDITFIILDNRTTAMTGHQPTPGVEFDVVGRRTPVQDIEKIVRGIASNEELTIARVNPERRSEYRQLLEETFLSDGVKVIISDKECGITRMRRKRRAERTQTRLLGFLPQWEHMNVNPEICRFCLSCTEMTGCPGLKHVQTEYGLKMDTDVTWCVNDGACERLGACSAFERVTIKRKRPQRIRVPELGLDQIAEPRKRAPGDLWRCCLAGFGGMGIGLTTQILVRAGHNEGYDVLYVDRKGLAIRNGGVLSQVVNNIAKRAVTGIIPYGKADLLLGIDILEAARALDPRGPTRFASKEHTAAVINTDKIQTIPGIIGMDDFDPAELEQLIRAHTRSDDYTARNISRVCEKYLGSKLYANIMMLGYAFQKGLIPVSMHSIAWAIKDTIHADFRKNLFAFNMGRKLLEDPELFQGPPTKTDWRDVLEEKCRQTIRRFTRGQKLADQLRDLAASTLDDARGLAEPVKLAFVVRLYDCVRWGGIAYARQYAAAVAGVYAKDSLQYAFRATETVIYNLANAMLIKDGVFEAELATSHEKHARDRRKYNVNRANGDKLIYRHFIHWPMKLAGKEVNLNIVATDWMLLVVRSMRYLRALLPKWHRRERDFLAEYRQRIAAFHWAGRQEYAEQLAGLASPQCAYCANPRCAEKGCPLSSRIPEWLQLVYQQRWRHACDLVHEYNNFPEFTARICPAPCQDACKQAINLHAVGIRDLEGQIVEMGFKFGWIGAEPSKHRSGKRVAVIGSGPAGLAAAQQLARAGHDVTVIEKEAAAGGLLRYGVPEFRLPKELVDRRVKQLEGEGVVFRTGTCVGRDVSADDLRKEFNAVLLTTGASKPRDLNVPGRQSPGVRFALDFLRNGAGAGSTGFQPVPASDAGTACSTAAPGCTLPPASPSPYPSFAKATEGVPLPSRERGEEAPISAAGKVVVVIGGGLTGEDCVELALRQGAKEVHQLEILAEPAAANKGMLGEPDDVPANLHRQWCVQTKGFSVNGHGRLRLSAAKVKWVNSPAGAVRQEVPASSFVLDADLALLALGFDAGMDKALTDQFALQSDMTGKVLLTDYATSAEGVFAAGDVVNGSSFVATAINSGRKAAQRVDRYLAR